MDVAGFGDRATLFFGARGVFRGNQAEVGHEPSGRGKAADVVDLTEDREGRQGLDAPQATEGVDLGSVERELGEAFELDIKCPVLGLKVLEVLKLDSQDGLERALQTRAQGGKPVTVLLGPGALALAEDMTVVAEDAGDPVLGGGGVAMVDSAQP